MTSEPMSCRFAMKIGSYYKDTQIQKRHFEKTARACEFSASEMIQLVRDLASKLPGAAGQVLDEMGGQGVTHPILEKLVGLLRKRVKKVLEEF